MIALFEKWPNKGHVFTEADITVVAWKRFPETFGLRGYANEYPDSKHILANIMGQKGLRAKRWISPLGATRYTLTPNPPKDTDGRREESGRGMRELQGK